VTLVELMKAPSALQTRVLRNIVARVKTRSGQLSKEHVEAVLELATQRDSGKKIQLPGGVEVRRERDSLRFSAIAGSARPLPENATPNYAYQIDLSSGEATLHLRELSCLLHFREIDWPAEGRETRGTGAVLDRDRLREPLMLRNWRPGDAMRPLGHQKIRKLARLLNEESVSRWDKAKWPVLTSGGKLVWAKGLPASAEFAAGPESRRAVRITEETTT
jgi:tRNA(Ile)-lysidine synthase